MSPKLRKLLGEVARLDRQLPLGTVAEEEFSEMLQELCKVRRHKGNLEALREEAIDVLVGTYTLLMMLSVSDVDIEAGMIRKCERTLERYETKGEL